jgi:translation initiation factor 1A
MGKNTMGGKHHKRGKNSNYDKVRKIIYADQELTLYGLVVSSLGDCRFLIHCSDRVDRIGLIRGALHKKAFINPEDIVLVSLRDFETIKDGVKQKCDIIMSYNSHEIEQLKSNGLFYKNTTSPFCTILENGKPAIAEIADDIFKFTNSKDDEPIPVIHDNSEDEDSDEDSLDKPIQYAPPPKRSNVKVIESSDNEPFDFDAI